MAKNKENKKWEVTPNEEDRGNWHGSTFEQLAHSQEIRRDEDETEKHRKQFRKEMKDNFYMK